MRILVTGSRMWHDHRLIWDTLDKLCVDNDLNYPPDEYGNTMADSHKVRVVHGACATGADEWCNQWAINNCDMRLVEPHPANWRPKGKFIKNAGMARNAEMVKLGADICLAFIMNASKGTTACADMAEKAGIETVRFIG